MHICYDVIEDRKIKKKMTNIDKINWTEKYRPRTLSQVAGHPKIIDEIRNWADEWKYGIPKYRAMVLYGKAGLGKCCKGNTLVLTDRGLIKIDDIVHKKIDFSNKNIDHGQSSLYDGLYIDDDEINEILKNENDNIKNVDSIISISPKLNYEKYKIIDRYDMGENDVITIKTRLGLEICGTPEHKIVIIDNNGRLRFKKLQDISTSDHVAISYNTNIFNEKLKLNFFYRRKTRDHSSQRLKNIDYMSQEIARLLGYIISEACASFDTSGDISTFKISTHDKEMQDDIINICNYMEVGARYYFDKRKGEYPVGVDISSIVLGNFIHYLGYRHLAQNKEIPWSILQANRECQISFLRALFDGDGTVGLENNDDPYVEYGSSSRELCRQLQIVLLNFGIIGRLYNKKGVKLEYRGEIREYEESYRLSILGGEILKFAKIINFGLSRKKEILEQCVKILENRDRWTDITYPNIEKIINRLYDELKILGQKGKIIKRWQEDFTVGDRVVKLNRQKTINCKEYLKNYQKNYQQMIYAYSIGKRRPSIYGLGHILSIMEPVSYLPEYKYLKMLSRQFIFDSVTTIKNERSRVYDVTIDDVHSYIGNSMVNHNTTTAYALANDMGWEIIELNASDQRTAKAIQKIVGSASKTDSLSGSKKLIIIDEADNIHGTADRGGEKELIGLIRETNHPIVLTANNFYDMSVGLRNVCKPVQFKSISVGTIMSTLRQIASSEKIICGVGVIEKIANRSEGDLRSAINDLEAISLGKTKLEISDIITGDRDAKENVFNTLTKIFKGKDIKEAYYSTFNIDQDPEDLIGWIDENLPIEYTRPGDLARGYDYLSRSSTFLGRVRRRQNYGMWKYASVLMTSGMVISKTIENKMYTKYHPPKFWKEIGQKKRFRSIRDSAAKKIGSKCHVSINSAKSELLPFFKLLMRNDRYALYIVASLDLNMDEIEFLTGYNPDIIQKIYSSAQKVIEKEKETDIELFGKFGESFIKEQKKREAEQKKKEIEDKKREAEQKKKEIEDKKREIDQKKKEIEDKKREIDQKKKEIEEQKEKKKNKGQSSLFDF